MSYVSSYREKLICEVLRLAQLLLKDYSFLTRLISKWNESYQRKSIELILYLYFENALCVSFVTNVDNRMLDVDRIVIDIGDAIEDINNKLISLET